MKWMTLNTDLIYEFSREGNLSELAFFFLVKVRHGNSTIFDATNHKLETKYGASRVTLKKHIKTLEKKNMLVKCGNNITCVYNSESTLKKNNVVYIRFRKKDTLIEIKRKLQFALLKKKAEQQSYIRDIRSDLDRKNARIDLRGYKKYVRGNYGEKDGSYKPELVMSNYKLAEMLSCSIQSVSRIKKHWKLMGLVKFSRRFKILGNVGAGNMRVVKDALPTGGFLAKNGVVRLSEASSFILMDEKRVVKARTGSQEQEAVLLRA